MHLEDKTKYISCQISLKYSKSETIFWTFKLVPDFGPGFKLWNNKEFNNTGDR